MSDLNGAPNGKVTILKHGASGNFLEPATSPETVGAYPEAIVAADLDGDSDPDLAIPDTLDRDVRILKNSGSGNFVEPSTSPLSTGKGMEGIVAADLDGDGDRDLAAAGGGSRDGRVVILKNNGSGDAWEADFTRGETPRNSLERKAAPASFTSSGLQRGPQR